VIDLPPDLALVLDTPRLRLVPLTVDEGNDLLPVLTDHRVSPWLSQDGRPISEERARQRLTTWRARRSVDGHEVWLAWVVRVVPSGEAVGLCRAEISDDRVARIGYLVAPDHAGRGIASEATGAVLRALRGLLGIGEVRAHIHPRNAASQRVARRIGLVPTGWLDERGEEVWSDQPGRGARTLVGVPHRVALDAVRCPTTPSSSPAPGSTTSRTSI
jgi:RimJ/RimL family protein N-acetyltransferase